MNAVNERKEIIPVFLAILVFACLTILPEVQALAPTPDGCYPNYTTAEGCNALAGLGAGSGNTGIGWYSLFSAGDSNFSTGIGGGALALNTADSNTAVGAAAMLLNTGGTLNVAVGTDAMVFNDTGGDQNTAVGAFALEKNITGVTNTALGAFAAQNTTGGFNVAVGGLALQTNTAGSRNTAVGAGAMQTGAAGNDNTAIGELAGNGLTGTLNTVLGSGAGTGITSGGNNVCIGDTTGSSPVTASGNIYIGHGVNPPGPGLEFNTVRIGDNLPTAGGASQCFIGGILSHPVPQSAGNSIVTIDPVTQQLGMTTDFSAVKVQEQQKKIEEQQVSIDQLKSEMQTMVAQLKEQAAQIQKVSAQLEMSKPAPQVVANKP